MEKYLVLATFVGSVIALLFALFTGKRVLRFEEGTPLMSKISRSIREGANAYLRRQYTVVGIFFACMIVVLEVRRQFKEITGLMDGKADPDYARCVDLCTKASLKEMVLPTVIAVVTPIVVGMVLGYKGVVGLLAGATVTGFLMAIYMANAGGAWDNAKKYIEAGNFGGKGSDCHKAGVVGDTVGDPFKDTSGPAINILIKLLSMVSIVFAGLIVNYSIL